MDWSQLLAQRVQGELQRAYVELETAAEALAGTTLNTKANHVQRARYDAASAWLTECYVNWKRAQVLAQDRTPPTPNPVP